MTFPQTRSSVLALLGSRDVDARDRAYDQLIRAYWQPIYVYLRLRWRLAPADAQDIAQGFLGAAWSKEYFESYQPGKSRFRTYLRVCLDRFVMKEQQASAAQRRGGGQTRVDLDFTELDRQIAHQDASLDENELFRREYARALMARSVERLRAEYEQRNRTIVFDVFQAYDLADAAPTYGTLAERLGLTVAQVTNHLHAARRRLRELVLEELRSMCASDDEYREEAREVLGITIA